ncbi:silent information regulator protein Sir2, partial [Enterococcus faecalis]
PRKRLHRK